MVSNKERKFQETKMDSISNDGQGAGRLSLLQAEWRIRRRVEEAVDCLGSWDITGHGSEP